MPRRLALLALGLMLAACSGGGQARPRFETSPGPTAPPRAVAAEDPPVAEEIEAPPPARMFAGTESSEGALEIYCERDRCGSERAGRPARYLGAPQSGFVVFTVHRAPSGARIEVLRRGDSRPSVEDLSPGTMMLFGVSLPAGRYVLTLVASWKDAEAHWLFGLEVGGTPSPES